MSNQRCAWCDKEQGRTPLPGESHGICADHRVQLLAEYRGECSASDVAGTYRELDRASKIDDARIDRIGEITTESGLMAARGVAIGFLGGLLILGTAWLAMLAL